MRELCPLGCGDVRYEAFWVEHLYFVHPEEFSKIKDSMGGEE
jgi:hypothetical protein